MRVALVNTKGGVGKTTSAAYLAAGLARQAPTLLVDADPQESVLGWAQLAGDGFPPTVGLATRDLDRRLPERARGYQHVVIDTGPGNAAIASAAVRAAARPDIAGDGAGLVVIPVAPTLLDLDRLRPTLELLAAVGDTPVVAWVLLTRVRARTIAGRTAREWLQTRGLPLLDQAITLREAYAASFGLPVADLGEYAGVLAELAAAQVAR